MVSIENRKNILLIMGNGFDLSCGLKSRYDDYFNWREDNLNQIVKNMQCDASTFEDYVENLTDSTDEDNPNNGLEGVKGNTYLNDNSVNGWDYVFALTKKYISHEYIKEWNDIENVIYNVVTYLLVDGHKWPDLKIEDRYKKIFSEKIQQCFKLSNEEVLSEVILNELKKFERNFANYIKEEVDKNQLYKISARELIKKLVRKELASNEIASVDILSFNYSLDADQVKTYNEYFERHNYKLKINSWYNIHGIANPKDMSMQNSNIILGIDITDLLGRGSSATLTNDLLKDPRIEFTKSFRIISEHVNMMRYADFNPKIDKIIIYGHSLNKMDYSYFRTIFEMLNLYGSSKLALELYYYPGEDKLTEEKDNIRKLVNLLVTYSKTLGDQYENSIVDKLVLEGRLFVVSMEKVEEYDEVENEMVNLIKPINKVNNINNHLNALSTDDVLFLSTIFNNTKSEISDWTEADLNTFVGKLRKEGYIDKLVSAAGKIEDMNPGIMKKAEELADFIGED